jgi:hypothetical protein
MIPTPDMTGEGKTTRVTTPVKLTPLRKIGRAHTFSTSRHFTTESFFWSSKPQAQS